MSIRVLLLALFLTELVLAAALLKMFQINRMSLLPTCQLDVVQWSLWSVLSLKLVGVGLDWYSFSELVLRFPGLQLPPTVRAMVKQLFRMPLDWLSSWMGFASGLELLLGGLLVIAFLLLAALPLYASLKFLKHAPEKRVWLKNKFRINVDWLVQKVDHTSDGLDIIDSVCSPSLLPFLGCLLRFIVCREDANTGFQTLAADPSTLCWTGWHAALGYASSALIASYLPAVFALGLIHRVEISGQFGNHTVQAKVTSAPAFKFVEMPLKAFAVGLMAVLPESQDWEVGAVIKMFGLLVVSVGLALAARYIGPSNYLALNRIQELASWSMCINTGFALLATLASVGESVWLPLSWCFCQIMLWRCFYGPIADQGEPGFLQQAAMQLRLRRCFRAFFCLSSLTLVVLATRWPEILAYNISTYHEELFHYSHDASLLMSACTLTVRPCSADPLCQHAGFGMIRRWGSLQAPLLDASDIMHGQLKRVWVKSTSYNACDIALWPRASDTLRVTTTGLSLIRVDAALEALHVKHLKDDMDEACTGLHAAVNVSGAQHFTFQSACSSTLWAVLDLSYQPLAISIEANGGHLDVRLQGSLASDTAECLRPNLTCLEGASQINHACNALFLNATLHQGTRLTVAEYQHPLQVAGVFHNSTLEMLAAAEWDHFIVFRNWPQEQTVFLQPAAATTLVHLPWEPLQVLKPWWLAVMSAGLFPLPPASVELQYEGCSSMGEVAPLVLAESQSQARLALIPTPGRPWQRAHLASEGAAHYLDMDVLSSVWAPLCVALCSLIAACGGVAAWFGVLLLMRQLCYRCPSTASTVKGSIFSPAGAWRTLKELPCFWSGLSALLAWTASGAESPISEMMAMPGVLIRSTQQARHESWSAREELDAGVGDPSPAIRWMEFHLMCTGQDDYRVIRLSKLLSDALWQVRQAAAEALGQLGPSAAPAVEQLGEALRDADADVRQAAARSLGQLGPSAAPAVEQLGKALSDTRVKVRQAAAEALGQLGPSAAPAVEQLGEALIVRQAAARSLGQLGPSVEQLGEALRDADVYVRQAAARSLGQLGPSAAPAVEQLGEALRDADEDVRQAAARSLGQLGPSAAPAVEQLGEALSDALWQVRQAAAEALGQLGPSAAPAVEQLGEVSLRDADADVRQAAARSLGQLGPSAAPAVEQLGKALSDTRVQVRRAAAEALGQLGPSAAPAVEQLGEALIDADADVRQAAARSLGQLGPSVEQLGEALRDADVYVRQAAARSLGQLGPSAAPAVEQLGEALRDADEDVRQAAARSLGQLGPSAAPAVEQLGEALSDALWQVRQAAAEALGQLGPSAAPAVEQLGEALRDADADVRQAAARSLGQLGPSAAPAVEQLGKALSDTRVKVRQAAAEALGQLGPSAAPAVEQLGKALIDADVYVVAATAGALTALCKAGVARFDLHANQLCEVVVRLSSDLLVCFGSAKLRQSILLLLDGLAELDHARALPCLMQVAAADLPHPQLRDHALNLVLRLLQSHDKPALATKASEVFQSTCAVLSCGQAVAAQDSQVHRQRLTHADLSCLTEAVCRFQDITRPRHPAAFDISSESTRQALRAFGMELILEAERERWEGCMDTWPGHAAAMLESRPRRPRHLNLVALRAVARRAAALQLFCSGKARLPRHLPYVLPVLRPGWLLVDMFSGLVHAFVCFAFGFWPCLISLVLAIAEEPYATWSPADHLSSLHLTRFTELPRQLMAAEPLGWILFPSCCASSLLLLCSCLHSYFVASLPCTFLHLQADAAARSAARALHASAVTQRPTSPHAAKPASQSGARAPPAPPSAPPSASTHKKPGPASRFLHVLHACLSIAWRLLVRCRRLSRRYIQPWLCRRLLAAQMLSHILPWLCCAVSVAAAAAYATLVLVWVLVGLLVDAQRMVPLVASIFSFAALITRRARFFLQLRKQVIIELHELAGKVLLRIVGAAIAALALRSEHEQSLERLKGGQGTDTDLFFALAQPGDGEGPVVSTARARLVYRVLLPKERQNLMLQKLAGSEQVPSVLDLPTFLAFQEAMRAEAIHRLIRKLGLDSLSIWRTLKRLSIVGLLLFALLFVVLTAFPISQDPIGLAVSGLLPVALGLLLNGSLPSTKLQDLAQQLEEQCNDWQEMGVDFLRQSQVALKQRLQSLMGLMAEFDSTGSGFLESCSTWLQQLDFLTIACLIEELGSAEQLLESLEQPALLLTKLANLQLQEALPTSVTNGLWHLCVDRGLVLLSSTLPLPDSVPHALKALRMTPRLAHLLQDAAHAAYSGGGGPNCQLLRLLCRLLRGLLSELPHEALQDLWRHLCQSACALGADLGVGPSLLHACQDPDFEGVETCLAAGLERFEEELDLDCIDSQSLQKSLEASLRQLTLQILAEALRKVARDLCPEAAASPQFGEFLDEVISSPDVLDLLRDPERYLRSIAAGAGNLSLQWVLLRQKPVLEQALGRPVSDQHMTMLVHVVGSQLFTKEGQQGGAGGGRGGLRHLCELLRSPASLVPHLLELSLQEASLLEPFWSWAREVALDFVRCTGLQGAVPLLESLDLPRLLRATKKVFILPNSESRRCNSLEMCRLLAQAALLAATESLRGSWKYLLFFGY